MKAPATASPAADHHVPWRDAHPQAWRIEAALIVAFWSFIFLLTVGQRAIDPRGPVGITPQQVFHTAFEYALWLLLTPGIFWLSRRFGLERTDRLRNLALHLGVALFVTMVMDYLAIRMLVSLIPEARHFQTDPFHRLLNLRFLDEFIIYLVVLATGFARDYFWRYRERQEETTRLRAHTDRLQAQLAEARLHALHMQINPHFLFNTLHAISSLVERDPRGVRRMIARLSELLRYTLDGNGTQEVPLQQELQFLHGYLEIQRIRFQGKLDVNEVIAPDVLEALVPNLILQPVVENAVKHGVSQIEGVGRIEIRAWRENEQLCLSVRDNGPGFEGIPPVPGENEGLGLRNTRARLESLYGTAQTLRLEPAGEGGVVARITLPFHTAADLHTTALVQQA